MSTTREQRALAARIAARTGINPKTILKRIEAGWPEGRLHEQPVHDMKRNAVSRRYTAACLPKPTHPWRAWQGPLAKLKPRTA